MPRKRPRPRRVSSGRPNHQSMSALERRWDGPRVKERGRAGAPPLAVGDEGAEEGALLEEPAPEALDVSGLRRLDEEDGEVETDEDAGDDLAGARAGGHPHAGRGLARRGRRAGTVRALDDVTEDHAVRADRAVAARAADGRLRAGMAIADHRLHRPRGGAPHRR